MKLSDLFDTVGSRRRFAANIQDALQKANNGDLAAVEYMVKEAAKRDGFKACYAVGSLSELQNPPQGALIVQISRLQTEDPFLREAAAHSIYKTLLKLGPQVFEKLQQELELGLAHIIRNNPDEGCSRNAVRILEIVRYNSPVILNALQGAIDAPDSYARKEAAVLRAELIAASAHCAW